MSMKTTNPMFFRIELRVMSQLSSSGFAERVFSTCKLLLAMNRGSIG